MENEKEENEVDKRSKNELDKDDNADECKQEDCDVEKEKDPKYPYPKSVFFIISTEFCERFSYYGMKTVLSLFLNQVLGYSEDTATILYHAFTALCYFTPIFGAVLADSFFGKYRTIFYISLVYALGQVVLTLGAIGDDTEGNEGIHGLPAEALSFIGLTLIGIGTGGIKPCVATFGGEQFVMPYQKKPMTQFFSLFYAAVNCGSLISVLVTPILRSAVTCFGQESCYPLAFGVPAGLMVIAVTIFFLGRVCGMYKMTKPEENIIVKTCACIWYAFKEWRKRKSEKLPSMLDYAEKKYGRGFVADVKALKNCTYIFLPLPFFWALFDQQGSRWTFQATRMNGETFGLFTILPDQMQVANPVLILLFIPLFDYGVYPLLNKCRICTTDLQKIVAGGLLAAVSFIVSGGLELALQTSYPNLPPSNQMRFHVYNGLNSQCDMSGFSLQYGDNQNISLKFSSQAPLIPEDRIPFVPQNVEFTVKVPTEPVDCGNMKVNFDMDFTFSGPPEYHVTKDSEGKDDGMNLLFSLNNSGTFDQDEIRKGLIYPSTNREWIEKSDTGFPFIKAIWNVKSSKTLELLIVPEGREDDHDDVTRIPLDSLDPNNPDKLIKLNDSVPQKVKDIGEFTFKIIDENGDELSGMTTKNNLRLGASYEYLLQYDENDESNTQNITRTAFETITKENNVQILWLIPQFAIMTAGEIMFSITTMQFSFTQAPESMKAVMLAMRYLTNAFGNIIDVAVIALLEGKLGSQAYEFFLFAGVMILDMILLAWMATGYTYVDYTTGEGVVKDVDENDNSELDASEKEDKES